MFDVKLQCGQISLTPEKEFKILKHFNDCKDILMPHYYSEGFYFGGINIKALNPIDLIRIKLFYDDLNIDYFIGNDTLIMMDNDDCITTIRTNDDGSQRVLFRHKDDTILKHLNGFMEQYKETFLL